MKIAAVLVGAGLLSGCAMAPGMAMNESAAVQRGREHTKDKEFKVEPITADLLVRLAEQRAKEAALVPDPQGSTPPPPYTIAPYDVLQVTVWDHPELTAPTGGFRSPEENGNPVNADGTVYYPHVGVVRVAGKTVTEVRQLFTERLTRVIRSPQLDVRIAAFRGKRVQVTGEVAQPSTMPLTDLPLRVQDAIAFAKGFTPESSALGPTGADPANVTLTRDGKTYHLDLLALYERRNLSQNWYDAPSIYRLDASSADALLLATQFPLQPKDVVYVSTYELTRWNRVIGQLVPTVQALYQAAITVDVAQRVR